MAASVDLMVHGLNSPKFRLIRIEFLVLLAVVGLLVLLVLGAYRRRSSLEAVKVIIWLAYAASMPLVSYTLGLMQSSPYKNSLFSVWALSLFLFLGSADSFSAYSLQDNDNWKRFYLEQIIQSFWVGWLIGSVGASDFWHPLWAIYAIILLKSGTRVVSFKLASRRFMLSESTQWVADYMSYEHELSSPAAAAATDDDDGGDEEEWDPVTMRGYRYVVAGEDKQKPKVEPPEYLLRHSDHDRAKLITIEQIVGRRRSGGDRVLLLLCGSDGERLKDVCLSMALSKMLNRRFAGYKELAESNLHKTHDFLFRGLLHGDSGCERAFRVIEVELAFVHDCFYTKYFIIYRSRHLFVFLSFAMVPFCGWLAYKLFQHFRMPNGDELKLIHAANNRNYEALFTFVIVIGIALVEGLQVYIYLASAWCKVALISNYAVRDSWNSRQWVAKLIGCVTSLKSFRSWENKLGQYTLLKKFDYKPINFMYHATFTLVDKTKKGHKEGKRVKLSMDVKKAVIDTLKSSSGRLTNGVTSLEANGLQDLSWSCTTFPTTTHTIMAWHIATTLCEAADDGQQDGISQPSDEQHGMDQTHRRIACSLSKYCTYLVAFAPELLPDHSFVSQSIFDALIDEATELLKGLKTLQERCERLREKAAAEPDDNRLIIVGARLGNHSGYLAGYSSIFYVKTNSSIFLKQLIAGYFEPCWYSNNTMKILGTSDQW